MQMKYHSLDNALPDVFGDGVHIIGRKPVYFEAELAMTELFGGYPDSFYRAYAEVNPIPSGYKDRRELYNLYHMLNHLNLFGTAYLGEVNRIVGRYV